MMHVEDTVLVTDAGAVVLVKHGGEWDAMRNIKPTGFDLFNNGDLREHVLITVQGMHIDDYGSLFGGFIA